MWGEPYHIFQDIVLIEFFFLKEISISEDLTSYWNQFKVSLSIPPTNQFIPQNLDILSPPQPTQDVPIRVDDG